MFDINKLTIIIGKLKRVQQKVLMEKLEEYNLSVFHVQYLMLFAGNNNELTLKEITELVDTNKSSTTRAVKTLIDEDILKKSESNKLRNYNLRLTDKGKKMVESVSQELVDYHLNLISALDNEDEENQLLYLIDKLLNKLDETNFANLD